MHVVPNSLPEHKTYNRYKTCGDQYMMEFVENDPKWGVMNNCGYDMAYYMLNHLTPNR